MSGARDEFDWPGLGRTLHAAGLTRDPELPERPLPASGWMVQSAAAFGAWMAAGLVIASLGGVLFGAIDQHAFRLLVGVATCAAMAIWARRRIDPATGDVRDSPFASQFMLALSIAGAGLLVSEIERAVHGHATASLLVGALATAIALANPEPLHRRLAVLCAVGAFAMAGLAWRLEPFVSLACAAGATVLWLSQPAWTVAGRGALLGPLAWSLALAAGALQLPDALTGEFRTAMFGADALAWTRGIRVIGLASILAAAVLAAHRRLVGAPAPGTLVLVVVGCALIAAGSWRMPGILACLIAWVLGTASGRAGLRSLALTGLGGYLWMAYWSRDLTLMHKGLAMIATAVVLAALAVAVRWRRTDGTWKEADA